MMIRVSFIFLFSQYCVTLKTPMPDEGYMYHFFSTESKVKTKDFYFMGGFQIYVVHVRKCIAFINVDEHFHIT